jgi:L-cystine uptake protein TcyP (sodium:dicarboxylate symporter family)
MESNSAVASYTFASLSDSSAQTVNLNAATRIVRITAENQGVYFKFATGVTKSNNGWDGYVPAGNTFDFAVATLNAGPISQAGRVMTFIGYAAGANLFVTELD